MRISDWSSDVCSSDLGHAKGRTGAHAVNRRRRSINQMRDGPVARQFENIDMPRDVRMDIGGRVFERIADAGLSAEMDDPLNGVAGECVGERVGVAKLDIVKGDRKLSGKGRVGEDSDVHGV